jgi:hypothetical protein
LGQHRAIRSISVARCNRPNQAEEIFRAYLAEHGVRFRFEPPWPDLFGVETTANPDFLVDPEGVRAICEVKHSERTKVWDQLLAAPETAMPVAPEDDWGPVRSKMRQAAHRKLRHFHGLGVPLVIVLANPVVSDVTLDFDTVAPAILGNDQQTVLVGPDGAARPGGGPHRRGPRRLHREPRRRQHREPLSIRERRRGGAPAVLRAPLDRARLGGRARNRAARRGVRPVGQSDAARLPGHPAAPAPIRRPRRPLVQAASAATPAICALRTAARGVKPSAAQSLSTSWLRASHHSGTVAFA